MFDIHVRLIPSVAFRSPIRWEKPFRLRLLCILLAKRNASSKQSGPHNGASTYPAGTSVVSDTARPVLPATAPV